MARILPPFAALRAFEAAARHCSFKLASEELNLSPSAVSHQIRSLEDFLGVCLFHRNGSTLEITELARTYRDEVARALNILEAASSRVEMARNDASLVINLFPSLASTWLLPRLAEFKAAHDEVNIRIVSSYEPVQFTGSDVDLAIRYAAESPQDAQSAFLFEEEIVPVCSPAYLEQLAVVRDPKSLLHGTLISCASHMNEWSDWFDVAAAKQGRPVRPAAIAACDTGPRQDAGNCLSTNGIEVENRAMALEAARGNLGLAMARTPFADEMIANGDLVVPVEIRVKTGMNYFLCWPERKARFSNVVYFRKWLLSSISGACDVRSDVLPRKLPA